MMKGFVTGILILITSFTVFSQNQSTEDVILANKEYNEGHYEIAIDLYEKVVDKGFASAELFYNLGNAYFKTDAIPESIFYYEKALKLDPRNKDIQFNLNIANSRKIDKIEEVPDLFYIKWWKSIKALFSPNNWAMITVIFFITIFIFGIFFIISRNYRIRKTSFWISVTAIAFFLLSLLISIQSNNEFMSDDYAIVFDPTITVKSSPTVSSVDLFVIHEGTKIEILDKVEGWYEIRIANGSEGWLPESAIKKI